MTSTCGRSVMCMSTNNSAAFGSPRFNHGPTAKDARGVSASTRRSDGKQPCPRNGVHDRRQAPKQKEAADWITVYPGSQAT